MRGEEYRTGDEDDYWEDEDGYYEGYDMYAEGDEYYEGDDGYYQEDGFVDGGEGEWDEQGWQEDGEYGMDQDVYHEGDQEYYNYGSVRPTRSQPHVTPVSLRVHSSHKSWKLFAHYVISELLDQEDPTVGVALIEDPNGVNTGQYEEAEALEGDGELYGEYEEYEYEDGYQEYQYEHYNEGDQATGFS